MGRKCRVKDCLSDSRRSEDMGVTFHKVPFHADIRPKWLSLCKIPSENQANKIIYVCSRHFRRNDFCTFKGTKYMLKQGVLPSMFSWTNDPSKTSKDVSDTKNEEPSTSKVDQPTENENNDVQTEVVEKVDDIPIAPVTKESPVRSRRSKKKSIDLDNKTEIKNTEKMEVADNEEEKIVAEKILTKCEDMKFDEKDITMHDEYIPVTDFTQGSRVEVTDFSGSWFPARIIEVDYTENEVFIEFDDSTKSNEWIPMDSKRLRQLMDIERSVQYDVGERVMAMWKNSIKFPATIQKSLGNDTYEVLFDDNIPLVLKSSKISKSNQSLKKMTPITPKSHPSPLFAPVEGSKQDRRDRKRKINVAELFTRKRPKTDSSVEKSGGTSGSDGEKDINDKDKEANVQVTPKIKEISTPVTPVTTSTTEGGIFSPNSGDWVCRWINGDPIGIPSVVDTRRSVIVSDPRLPDGWIKHLVCRAQGTSAGKWDTVIICPDGKKFRSKNDVQAYLEKEKLPHPIEKFDFSLHLKKARSLGLYEINENIKKQTPKTLLIPAAKGKVTPKVDMKVEKTEKEIVADDSTNNSSLKIICENGAYKCPIEGCAKTFRKENLTQMHVKHYHPEYSKFIGSTPNVADLAYARTVGEPIEDFLPKSRLSQGNVSSPTAERKPDIPKSTVRTSISKSISLNENEKSVEGNITEPETNIATTPVVKQKSKESEIVKILTNDSKTSKDVYKMDTKLMSKISSPKYDKKDSPQHISELKDVIEKREPKHHPLSEIKENKNTFENKPHGGGIKTLLPVIRTSQDSDKKHIEPPSPYDTEELPKPPIIPKNVFGKHLKRRRNNSEADTYHRRRRYTKHDYEYYADYHDAGSRSPDYVPYTRKKKTVEFNEAPPTVAEYNYQPQHPKQIVTDTGEVIKIVTMKQEEIINCTCGFMEEDGLMIQCELCLCWQHAYCNSIEREDQVPEKYICYICQNPLRMRASRKYFHDQDWLKQGTLATASFHAVDENVTKARFERLRKSHELSGNIHELSSVMHSLRVKLKIAENKDHPKFYLWSKPWPKIELDNNIEDLLNNQNRLENVVPPEVVKEEIVPSNDIESSLSKLLDSNEPVDPNKQLEFENEIISKPETTSSTTNNELLNILEGNEGSDTKITDEDVEKKDTLPPNIELPPKKDADNPDLKSNKNWIDGGVMCGEVSDGEMISQALASEALANDLLSSPTTLNLSALTPSDIEKIQNTIDNSASLVSPCVPEPEAKIESDACRENLIENISHYQKLINDRMDRMEEQIKKLEDESGDTHGGLPEVTSQNDVKMKEAFVMLIRDLGKIRKLAALY